jgi:hypothetical protein
MRGKQYAHLFDAMHKRFGKVTTLEARLHPLNDFTPEIVSTFGVHAGIPDHRKSMRHRRDEDQYCVPRRCPVHFQLCKAKSSRTECVVRFSAANEDAYLAARPFFGSGNGRHNSVVIDSLEEMLRFHAESSIRITNHRSRRRRRCHLRHRKIHCPRLRRRHHRLLRLHRSTRSPRIRVTLSLCRGFPGAQPGAMTIR